jgi:hypothetical protein
MKIATQLFFILSLMQVLFYIKNKNLGCLLIYSISFLLASFYSKKILNILLISSLSSLLLFDCSSDLKEGVVGIMCPDNLLPNNLKTKKINELETLKKQCVEQKKSLENDIAVRGMTKKEKKEKEKQVKTYEEKIRYIEEEIFNKKK